MARPVTLFTFPWIDRPLAEVAQKAGEWGYQGLELACGGDHFEVQRAASENNYCQKKLELMARNDLTVAVLNNHRVGQAVADVIDERHKTILPDYVWGNGRPEEVRQRAAEEMMATARGAQKMGVAVVAGFTGSPLWSYVVGYPPATPAILKSGFKEFAKLWNPILDVCKEAGIKFALEVHPGQIAFDLYTAEMALEALNGREEFGFLFDPSHLHWQGVDPVEFLRHFPNRIFHVHMRDVVMTLNGRTGILGSYLPLGHSRRGWDFRSPGHGGIDWEAIIRALNEIGYDGPLSVDWKDMGMDRDFGAEDACRFAKRLDFESAGTQKPSSGSKQS
jgi:sugar phosphate isomerase/epimerase